MKRYLLIILAGAAYFAGISICCAYDWGLISLSPNDVHMQAVNQELDKIESSGVKPAAVVPSPLVPKTYEFTFGPELYWAKYDEPKNMYQKGFMSGYNAQFSQRINTDPKSLINMFRLQGQWAKGKFKTQSSDQGPSGIKDNTFELRGVLGKDFYPASYMRTTGYFGFGYRYLKDNSEGLTTVTDDYTLIGYRRFSHYCYLPLGADIVYQRAPNYSLESNLEYDYMFNGWHVSKLGDVPGYSTLVVDQRNGNGLRASLRLNLYLKYCTAFAEWFYRYWNIPQSKSKPDPTDPANSLNEPKNNTQEFGLRLGIQI